MITLLLSDAETEAVAQLVQHAGSAAAHPMRRRDDFSDPDALQLLRAVALKLKIAQSDATLAAPFAYTVLGHRAYCATCGTLTAADAPDGMFPSHDFARQRAQLHAQASGHDVETSSVEAHTH